MRIFGNLTGSTWKISLLLPLMWWAGPAVANADTKSLRDECLINALNSASDEDTVGMLREKCQSPQVPDAANVANDLTENLLDQRIAREESLASSQYSILQHKANYFLPLSYNSKVNEAPFAEISDQGEFDSTEFKFQISLKVQLTEAFNDKGFRLFVAYTNQSWWQAYNGDLSGPFRETNHEPEFFIDFDTEFELGSWDIPLSRIGFVHQSNGRSGSLSRGWNRIYAQFFIQKENWALSFKPWLIVDTDSTDHDNPDIQDFLGNFEFGVVRKGKSTTSSVLFRNNLESDNKSAFQYELSRALPGTRNLRLFFQYFYGYGESLIDYNVVTNRASLGFRINDYL